MFFQYGHPMLNAANRWDQLDVIGRRYVAEEHIWPSKYDSRLRVVSRICDALEELEIVSICGNGATSLAKKLSIAVKIQEKFPTVAMVTVSPNPNLEKIRRGIVQQVGGTQIDNCLLILDGFWWELNNEDFQTIGIPSPSINFKIVFTSRDEDTCKKIGRHQIHHVDFLEDDEAWDLFREIAGKSVVAVKEMARKVVDECDGFHISILLVASALKDKPPKVWKESLKMLQNTNRKLFSDMERVFSWICSSYDRLNDNEAQLIFLICCLFPEDFSIPVEDLVLFAKGLQLFEHVNSMHQVRDRVEGIVHKLKNSFFLVDGDEDDFIKVHNMCRDFGVSESSTLVHPHVVRCENNLKDWPLERMDEQIRAISLMCKTVKQHPVDLKCPNLYLLQLSYERDSAQLPAGIFRGLGNLKVLSLSIPSLFESLTVLKNLRTLCITENISDNSYVTPRPRFGDLLGDEMKDLEILSFSTARPYNDFPRQIGLLHNLRYLRFNRDRLKYIPPGVLSKLAKLEELHLPLDFIGWGHKEEGERMNATLAEIESLPLSSLTIGTSTGSVLAENFVEKLTRFCVFVGSHVSPDHEFATTGNLKKSLEVFDVDADDFTVSWISDLVWKSESLRLKQVRHLKNVITWQRSEDGNFELPQWKKICISDCKELEYIAMGRIPWTSFSQLESLKLFGLCNMKELWPGLYLQEIKGSCFGNLAEIQIMFCRKLKYVVSVSVAVELRQLQSLQICFCDEMEEVFYGEQMNNDDNQSARRNALKSKLQPRDPMIETTSAVNKSIHHKSKHFSLTSNSITRRLFARGKQQMEENGEIIFPRLKTLELAYMNNLGIFYNGNHHAILLPSLESFSIFQCNHLEAFSYGLLRTPSLQQIQINGNRYSVREDLNAILKNFNRARIEQAMLHDDIQDTE